MQHLLRILPALLLTGMFGPSAATAAETPMVSFSIQSCTGPTEKTQIGVVVACMATIGDTEIKVYVPSAEVEKHKTSPKN